MERLTIKTPQGPALKMGDTYPSEEAAREDLMRLFYVAVARLAAYEDTECEPEEIERILNAYGRGLTLRGDVSERVELIRGIPTERIKELAQAEKDGRLAVLPCKVGRIVYDISDGTPYATWVLDFSYFGDRWACRTVNSYPNLKEFGDTIFLTRKEAEAALKMREEGAK